LVLLDEDTELTGNDRAVRLSALVGSTASNCRTDRRKFDDLRVELLGSPLTLAVLRAQRVEPSGSWLTLAVLRAQRVEPSGSWLTLAVLRAQRAGRAGSPLTLAVLLVQRVGLYGSPLTLAVLRACCTVEPGGCLWS
jgi:hypothetical protein